jgi:hypothetical protein
MSDDEQDEIKGLLEEPGDAELLRLLAAARRAPEPEMSEAEAEGILARVRARAAARAGWWKWAAAAVLVAAVGLLAWSHRRPAPVLVKDVFFESVHDGKVVHFEMQVYRVGPTKK